jgi:proteic killer suppression protein
MQFLRAATDERDLRAMKSMRFEKLKGARSHQFSLRLQDQWRLILEIEVQGSAKTLVIVEIEDYH